MGHFGKCLQHDRCLLSPGEPGRRQDRGKRGAGPTGRGPVGRGVGPSNADAATTMAELRRPEARLEHSTSGSKQPPINPEGSATDAVCARRSILPCVLCVIDRSRVDRESQQSCTGVRPLKNNDSMAGSSKWREIIENLKQRKASASQMGGEESAQRFWKVRWIF